MFMRMLLIQYQASIQSKRHENTARFHITVFSISLFFCIIFEKLTAEQAQWLLRI